MKNPWHSGRILAALMRSFCWFQNTMITEWPIDGSQADLLVISKAGYATEIEIKVSMADWNADRKKPHWNSARPHVARFFYCIPHTLADKIPEWVPAHVGILVVYERSPVPGSTLIPLDGVRCLRNARRMKAQKMPDDTLSQIYRACYYRLWKHKQWSLQQRINDQRMETINGKVSS